MTEGVPKEEGPIVKAPPENLPLIQRAAQIRNQLRDIVRDYKSEPNIPFTHEYWFLKNILSSLEREIAGLK